MATGAEQARDLRFGRRGNRWTRHSTIDFANAPRCDRCAEAMILGQPKRHWTCADMCDGRFRRVIDGRNCHCAKARQKKEPQP
jgi:hypothetical protein